MAHCQSQYTVEEAQMTTQQAAVVNVINRKSGTWTLPPLALSSVASVARDGRFENNGPVWGEEPINWRVACRERFRRDASRISTPEHLYTTGKYGSTGTTKRLRSDERWAMGTWDLVLGTCWLLVP